MLLLIPIGGLGTRFSKFGYSKPKPLINVLGKPILFWLFDNLDLSKITNIIIPYHPSLKEYRFEDLIKKKYPELNFNFKCLEDNTEGASHTIKLGLESINLDDQPILCLDSDNFYTTNIIEKFINLENKNVVLSFKDNTPEPIYSYSKINQFNQIIDIKEKEKISDYANTGGYGFQSWKELLENINFIMKKKIKQKNEYYTSTVISNMIKNNKHFNILEINQNNFICLGTPLQVRLFCNNYPKYSIDLVEKIKPKRFCFDLDNTLVTFPKIKGDYTSCKPIEKNIKLLRYLKKFDHTIIIYTARRMNTHNGNQGKVLADIGRLTFDQLERFEIPYDEIYFGKPLADFYIDDLGVSAFENLEKELGFYENTIEARSFNNVSKISINLYRKSSEDLSGEIYYYNNIPKELKDLFPLMLRYDDKKKWYDMERINGVPISKLYLSEELTIDLLNVVLNSIERLHSLKIDNNNLNIYKNYVKKIDDRYKMINYKEYENSENIYNELKNYFENYENKKLGEMCVIHGDPVFTNILINQFGKIKLIDMRGKVGDINSIYGDKFYDLGKIYQSLIGYDEVLEGRMVSKEYKNKLLEYFEKRYEKDIDLIKMICKMLIFTLIPLHEESKRIKFWSLLKNK